MKEEFPQERELSLVYPGSGSHTFLAGAPTKKNILEPKQKFHKVMKVLP